MPLRKNRSSVTAGTCESRRGCRPDRRSERQQKPSTTRLESCSSKPFERELARLAARLSLAQQ
jgi:hypothetical protein